MTSIGKRLSEPKATGTGQEVLWLASSEPPASLLTFLRSRGLTLVSQDDATTSAPLRLLWIDPAARQSARAPSLGGRRIAVMHPDPGNADALAQALRARGAEVVALSLNPDSLHRVETLDPDAVIMEAEDFCSSCWEIVRALWQHPRLRFATIVLATPELMGSQVTALDVHDLSFAIAEVSADYARIAGEAKREEAFSFELSRLGPSRTLRALLEAGRTLRVVVRSGEATVEIDLAEQIVVGAQSPAGAAPGEGLLGVHALQFLLAQRQGQVDVRAVDHPAHTNVMAPLDTALHMAHEASSAARSSGLHRPMATNPGFTAAPQELPTGAPAQGRAPALHSRTLIGVPAVKVPASLKAEAAATAAPARPSAAKSFAPPRPQLEPQPQAPAKSARKHATMIGMPVVARPEPQRSAPQPSNDVAKPAMSNPESPAAKPAASPGAGALPARPSAAQPAPAQPSRAPAAPAPTPSRVQPKAERVAAEPKAERVAAEPKAAPPPRPAPEMAAAPAPRAPAPPKPRAPEAPARAVPTYATEPEDIDGHDVADEVSAPALNVARSSQFAQTMLAAPAPQLAAPEPAPLRAPPAQAQHAQLAPAQSPPAQPPAMAFANTEPPPANPTPLSFSESSALDAVVMDEDWARPRPAWQSKLRTLANRRVVIGAAVAVLCAAVAYGLSTRKGSQISATPLPSLPVAQAAAPAEPVAPAPVAKTAPTPVPAAAEPSAEQGDEGEADADDELDSADKREGARRASQLVKEANNLRRKRKASAARARYLEALEALPDYPRALAGLVQLALAQDNGQEALDFAKQLVRARSGQGPYQLLLGDAQRAVGNTKEARAAYQTALKLGSRAAKERLSEL